MTLFVILITSHSKEGVDISMRKDIKVEKKDILIVVVLVEL